MVSCIMLSICALSAMGYSFGYVLDVHEVNKNNIDQESHSDNRSLFYNLSEEVKFYLYTRSNPSNGLLVENMEILKTSHFDKKKPSKFLTHGFKSSGFSDTCQEIKEAYLKEIDVNVIIMDWERIASNLFYFIPAAMTIDIGQYFAKFVDAIVEYGSDPMKIHLVGHSLGAHISGFTGKFSKYRLGRITGLDPAFPSFGLIQLVGARLNYDQAHFVDVIHTSAGTLGLREAIGHIDFYPNGGTLPQPGCRGLDEVIQSCSHGRSWQYFKESIDPKIKFVSFKSRSYEEFLSKYYIGVPELLGEYTSKEARGTFYLKTNSEYPFATKE